MVEQVEHSSTEGKECILLVSFIGQPTGCTQSGENVRQLTHGRIGQNTLDIIGHEGDQCRHESSEAPNPSNQHCNIGQRSFEAGFTEDGEHSGHKVQTGVDHGCRVNQSGYRGWTLHRIGQPYVQWELRRFTHTTNEHHDQWPLKICTLNGSTHRGVPENDSKLKAVIQVIQHEQSNHEEYIAYTRSQECLLGCGGCTRFFPIEADEKVRTETHDFPEDEQPKETVSQHHAEHSHAKQYKFSEEAVVAVFVLVIGCHVSNREPTNQETEESGDEENCERDTVNPQSEAECRSRPLAIRL